MLDSVAESDRDKAFLDKYKARLAQIDEDTAEIARLKEEKKGAEKLRREVIASKIFFTFALLHNCEIYFTLWVQN